MKITTTGIDLAKTVFQVRGVDECGKVYLRTLLIHGARAVIRQSERKPDPADGWLKKLLARGHKNVAAVALAARSARLAWALLAA